MVSIDSSSLVRCSFHPLGWTTILLKRLLLVCKHFAETFIILAAGFDSGEQTSRSSPLQIQLKLCLPPTSFNNFAVLEVLVANCSVSINSLLGFWLKALFTQTELRRSWKLLFHLLSPPLVSSRSVAFKASRLVCAVLTKFDANADRQKFLSRWRGGGGGKFYSLRSEMKN